MTKAPRSTDYLNHILEAIERIDRYTEDMDEVGFLNNELVQDAVIRNIEIIGEASNNIQRVAPTLVEQSSNVPWRAMYDMRNSVSHGYHKVDMERVWNTVENDLPELYQQVLGISQQQNVLSESEGKVMAGADAEKKLKDFQKVASKRRMSASGFGDSGANWLSLDSRYRENVEKFNGLVGDARESFLEDLRGSLERGELSLDRAPKQGRSR